MSIFRIEIQVSIVILTALLILTICGVPCVQAEISILEISPVNDLASSKAYGINNAGSVCGKSYSTGDDDVAMIRSSSGTYTILPHLGTDTESGSWAINNSGQVSGFSENDAGQVRAVLWMSDTTIHDIGTLQNQTTSIYGNESSAYGLNNSGHVVGLAEIPNDDGDFIPYHAFHFNGDTLQGLGTLNTTSERWQYGYSIAYYIADNGDIVGMAYSDSNTYKPFVFDTTEGMQPLTIDPAFTDEEWYSTVINENGMIGGHVIVADEGTYPYYWVNKSGAPVPLEMPSEFPNGEIYGINSYGQMVGIMWNNDTEPIEHAFIFDKIFGVRDLNDLIEPTIGWTLNNAREINDNGLLVGTGVWNGNTRGYILDSLNLNRQGDISNDGKVDLSDAILTLKVIAGSIDVPVNQHAAVNGTSAVDLADAIFALRAVATP